MPTLPSPAEAGPILPAKVYKDAELAEQGRVYDYWDGRRLWDRLRVEPSTISTVGGAWGWNSRRQQGRRRAGGHRVFAPFANEQRASGIRMYICGHRRVLSLQSQKQIGDESDAGRAQDEGGVPAEIVREKRCRRLAADGAKWALQSRYSDGLDALAFFPIHTYHQLSTITTSRSSQLSRQSFFL